MSGRNEGDEAFVIQRRRGRPLCEVRRFDDVDSTNRYLVDQARAGVGEGLVAVARHQRAGRGRLGRRWEAPAGTNLLLSVLLRPRVPPAALHLYSAAMALAAADACRVVTGLEPSIKWPNDLMVGPRKLAGILAEADAARDVRDERAPALVVGLGLNVTWPPLGRPDASAVLGDWRGRATSLWRETGRRLEPDELLEPVLAGFETRIDRLADQAGRADEADEFRRRCATVGRLVQVTRAHDCVRGTAVGITPEGHLVVQSDGARKTVSAGDVVHLR